MSWESARTCANWICISATALLAIYPVWYPHALCFNQLHDPMPSLSTPVSATFSKLVNLSRLVLRSGGVVSMSGRVTDTGNLLFQYPGYFVEDIRLTSKNKLLVDPFSDHANTSSMETRSHQ